MASSLCMLQGMMTGQVPAAIMQFNGCRITQVFLVFAEAAAISKLQLLVGLPLVSLSHTWYLHHPAPRLLLTHFLSHLHV